MPVSPSISHTGTPRAPCWPGGRAAAQQFSCSPPPRLLASIGATENARSAVSFSPLSRERHRREGDLPSDRFGVGEKKPASGPPGDLLAGSLFARPPVHTGCRSSSYPTKTDSQDSDGSLPTVTTHSRESSCFVPSSSLGGRLVIHPVSKHAESRRTPLVKSRSARLQPRSEKGARLLRRIHRADVISCPAFPLDRLRNSTRDSPTLVSPSGRVCEYAAPATHKPIPGTFGSQTDSPIMKAR